MVNRIGPIFSSRAYIAKPSSRFAQRPPVVPSGVDGRSALLPYDRAVRFSGIQPLDMGALKLPRRGRLFVFSGPSGAGKGTLLRYLREQKPDLKLSVSCTTRSMRQGEVDGVHYRFVSEEKFQQMIQNGEFIEHAKVHALYYGTLRYTVEEALAQGDSLILEIDVQGAEQIKRQFPDACLIFIEPPSLEVLKFRLDRRGTESEKQKRIRLKNAEEEMRHKGKFDHIITNDDYPTACAELLNLVDRLLEEAPAEG